MSPRLGSTRHKGLEGLLEGGRRNEGARGSCVTAGGRRGATRAPDELKTREAEKLAETGVSDGRGEADLRAQRRDHEGPRVEHGAGAKRAPTGRN